MSNRTNIYKFLYLQEGDKWYPGYDYENMLTVENQLEELYTIIGTGVKSGWEVTKLSDERTDQINLLDGYLNNTTGDYGQRLIGMNLDFTIMVKVATTANISLSGLQTIDGISLTAGQTVLVKNQTSAINNGIYTVASGSWTRSTDLNASSDYNSNFLVYVEYGTTNEQTLFQATSPDSTFVLGTSALYFYDAFLQCVKVSAGTGIVGTFSAKTDNINYFRLTNENEYYVWATPGLILQSDGICSIVVPAEPDDEYDTYNTATFLASVNVAIDVTTNSSLNHVLSIEYGERRVDLNSLSGNFQEELRKSFLLHRHLGSIATPSKINLSGDTILPCENSYDGELSITSTIFIIKNEDGSLFTGDFNSYGIPRVYLNDVLLSSSEYRLLPGSINKIYLRNSVKLTDRLEIRLRNVNQSKLYIIDDNGSLLTTAAQSGIYYKLSDLSLLEVSALDGTTYQVFKNLTWSENQYIAGKVYANNVLMNEKLYTINPSSGTIILSSDFISSGSYNLDDIYIVIEKIGIEYSSELSSLFTEALSGESFKNFIAQKRLKNISHFGEYQYKKTCSFYPTNNVVTGLGNSYFYPVNTISDLQYNFKINYIYNSANFSSNNLLGTERGLLKSSSFTNFAFDYKFTADYDRSRFIIDNLLNPENQNYFKTTYSLNKNGVVYYTINNGKSWKKLKSTRLSNGNKNFVNSFDISTDKVSRLSSTAATNVYSSFLYAATNHGLYTAHIYENTAIQDWNWRRLENLYDSSSNALSFDFNVNAVKELSTKNIVVNSGGFNTVTYDRHIYMGSTAIGNSGLYSGTLGNMIQIFTDPVIGIEWIKTGTNNVNKNNILFWTKNKAYITHSSQYVSNENESYWLFPYSSAIASSNVLAATDRNLFATYSSAATPHSLTLKNFIEDTTGTVSINNSGTGVTGLNTNFKVYSGLGISIGIGFTSANTVTTWYPVNTISDNNSISLSTTYAGSSIANTSYVIYIKNYGFTVDNYTYSSTGASQTVLVKNQNNNVHNGVYYVDTQGSTSVPWVLKRSSNIGTRPSDNVTILNGTVNNESIWYLDRNLSTVNFGSSSINWYITKFKIYQTASTDYQINTIVQRNADNASTNEYILGHSNGIARIIDPQLSGTGLTSIELPWEKEVQGSVNHILSKTSASANGALYIASDKGLFNSTDDLWGSNLDTNYWVRTENMFNENDEISVFNSKDNSRYVDFNSYYKFQTFKFDNIQGIGTQYLFANSYNKFYTSPWENTSRNEATTTPDVVVYVNDVPTTVPYFTDATTGLVNFTSSLKIVDYDNVKVSISRNNAYLKNNGSYPHEEEVVFDNRGDVPIAVLAIDNLASSDKLYVNVKIDTTTKLLLLDNGTTHEVVYVKSINNSTFPYEVSLFSARENYNSTTTFLSGTNIYKLSNTIKSSIQDKIYTIKSHLPYNFDSLNNVNHLQLILGAKANIPYLFNFASPLVTQTDTRGLQKLISTNDFVNDTSLFSSEYSVITSSSTQALTFEKDPLFITNILNPSKTGTTCKIATDKGIWEYSTSSWRLEDNLNETSRIYFLKQRFDNSYIAGTNEGLFTGNAGTWTSSYLFREKIYDFSEGIFNGMSYEAYAKSNGFAFNVTNIGSTSFTSDEFKLVSGQNVFGIYKGTYSLPSSQTNASITNDAIYLFTDTNIYGVTTGTVTSQLSSILVGKEMLSSIPTGVTEFYKAFEPLPISFSATNKSVAKNLFVLTDSGVLKIDNWNICDVTNANDYFNIADHFLNGYQCYCFATSEDTTAYPSKSKVFIGTNHGVYRSFDCGNTFEPANRFNNEILTVFDLNVFESTVSSVTKKVLLAATSKGLWYSIDDGDNWQKSGENDSAGTLYCEADSMPTYYDNISATLTSNGFIAQRFLGAGLVDKIFVRLKVNNLSSNSGYQTSLANNVISAYIYTDSGGSPSISPAAISTNTYAPSAIVDKEYLYFNFNYTTTSGTPYYIVIKEVVSSIALVSWMQSSELSTLSSNSLQSTNGTSWTNLGKKYFYQIVYSTSINENDTIVPVGNYDGSSIGWDSGTTNGTIVDDDGQLYLIPKLLVSFAVDDTYSMGLVDTVNHKTGLDNLWLSLSNFGYDSTTAYYSTYADVWTINDKISEKTSGFISDQTTVSDVFDNLKLNGKKYEYFDTVSLAMNGLNYQSIIDAIIKDNDEANNVIRCEAVKDYLESINCLRLQDIITRYDNEAKDSSWDQTAATISSNAFARRYMVERFASTYTPVLFCITDGDNLSDTTITDLIRKAKLSWKNYGSKVIVIYNSNTANQRHLNDLAYQNSGQIYVASSSSDWNSIIEDLVPLATNSLYNGYWNKSYEFIDKKYIKTINSTYIAQLNSSCSVQFRYSMDYKNFSSWIDVLSGVPYELNLLVTNLEYKIEMSEGYYLGTKYYPHVDTLYHVESEPSTYYLFSKELSTTKNLNEYIFTSNIESFDNFKFEWGICRGDSLYWNDYNSIINGRNGILPNRQKSIQFTPIVDEKNLSTSTTDNFSYTVLKNNSVFTWNSSSTVSVFVNNILVNGNDYRYNEFTGNILFDSIRASTDIVTVNIYTPEILYFNAGENTTTNDNQIYFLSNGTWPTDSQVVVLINNEIVRGFYQEDRLNGSILFDYKLKDSDIVTVYILPSNTFRIAAKVSLYDSVEDYVLLNNLKFGLEYTEIDHENTALQYSATVVPEIADNQLRILSSGKGINDVRSTHERMYVDYEFSSTQNNKESNSIVRWYRTRSASTSEVTEYYKKYVEGSSSLNEADTLFIDGDEVYVELEPSDGFKFGNTITSNTVELTSNYTPYVLNPLIKSDANIINNAIVSGNSLVASYSYVDVDFNNDESTINWYDWSSSKTLLYTGTILPSSYVTSGKVISYEITPYNGTIYGSTLWSQYVYVV